MSEMRNGPDAGKRLTSAPCRRNLRILPDSDPSRLRLRRIVTVAPLNAAAFYVSARDARFLAARLFYRF